MSKPKDPFANCIPDGTECIWRPGVEGLPARMQVTVVGVGMNPLPVVGHMYIVDLSERLPNYPYGCMLVPETSLKPIPPEDL